MPSTQEASVKVKDKDLKTGEGQAAKRPRLSRHAKHRGELRDSEEAFTSLENRMKQQDLAVARNMAQRDQAAFVDRAWAEQQAVWGVNGVTGQCKRMLSEEIAFLEGFCTRHPLPAQALSDLEKRRATLTVLMSKPPFTVAADAPTSSSSDMKASVTETVLLSEPPLTVAADAPASSSTDMKASVTQTKQQAADRSECSMPKPLGPPASISPPSPPEWY